MPRQGAKQQTAVNFFRSVHLIQGVHHILRRSAHGQVHRGNGYPQAFRPGADALGVAFIGGVLPYPDQGQGRCHAPCLQCGDPALEILGQRLGRFLTR